LTRKYNPNSARPRIFDGAAEAKLIALTLSPAPEGFARWSLRLLREQCRRATWTGTSGLGGTMLRALAVEASTICQSLPYLNYRFIACLADSVRLNRNGLVDLAHGHLGAHNLFQHCLRHLQGHASLRAGIA
jgi:hypothetical protein